MLRQKTLQDLRPFLQIIDDVKVMVPIRIQVIIETYIGVVSYTLLYYDYALTLPAEVDRYWSTRKISWTSTFFYLNRYLSLFGHIPAIVQRLWVPQSSDNAQICASITAYHQYLLVVIQVIIGILLIIRTYALYERNLRVLLSVFSCGLAATIFSVWSVVSGHDTTTASINSPIACMPTDSHDANRLANAWIGMLLFDLLIFIMTAYKSWGSGDRVRKSLFKVILRDGTLYFGIMAILELVTVIAFYVLPGYLRDSTASFVTVVASTMISRLMLNLRDPEYSTQLTHPTLPSALVFDARSNTTYDR